VLQEGELTAVDIAHAVEHHTPFSHIPGIVYKDKPNGEIRKTEKRPFLEDLDSLPFPARHLVPLHKFESDSRGNMITSRGCPYACKFCCVSRMHGTAFRARSPENVLAEMRELVDTYDVHYSKFIDDTFSYSRNRVNTLCDLLIAEDIDMTWGCNTRADRVNKPLLSKMKKARCVDIYFGIESVNQHTLDAMGKGQTIQQVKKAITLTQECDIKVTGSIIIGLPFETREDVLRTLQFVEGLHLDRLGIQILAPHPGSDIYDNLKKYGITLLNDDYTLQNQFNPIIETSELTKEDIIDLTLTALEIGASRGSIIL
jgi:anaerobic magnesium-protoporphyrin IX monomethyl ester cyclase